MATMEEDDEVTFVKRLKTTPTPEIIWASLQPPSIAENASSTSAPHQLHFECFICGTALHFFDDLAKDAHLNQCLDKLEPDSGKLNGSEGIRAENYGCMLCGLSLNSKPLITRCQHLKRCSKIHGIGIRELLQMIAPERYEEVWTQLDQSMSQLTKPVEEAKKPNANDILMANARVKWHPSAGIQTLPSSSGSNSGPSMSRPEPKRRRDGSEQGAVDYAPEYKKVSVAPMTTPVIVDGFSFASATLSDCYFLTHFHSDHYSGLTRAFEYGLPSQPPLPSPS
jgi:hypothetical protein